ncbi:hypothetical protein SUGI_0901870 [Cryptomeria japonica]|nr:hypothetical protein SUGI_0901870 [Cryptomeria japonica]
MGKVRGELVKQATVWLFIMSIVLLQSGVMAIRLHQGGAITGSTSFPKDQMEFVSTVEEKQSKTVTKCENDVDEEECMDRRTLAAHTDYIYSQKDNGP